MKPWKANRYIIIEWVHWIELGVVQQSSGVCGTKLSWTRTLCVVAVKVQGDIRNQWPHRNANEKHRPCMHPRANNGNIRIYERLPLWQAIESVATWNKRRNKTYNHSTRCCQSVVVVVAVPGSSSMQRGTTPVSQSMQIYAMFDRESLTELKSALFEVTCTRVNACGVFR